MRDQLRKLWGDHVFWTRQALISVAHGLPDFDSTLARLLRNQDELGEAVARMYGAPIGRELQRLLREHVNSAAALFVALRRNDIGKATAADRMLRANAENIARVLHQANPAWDVEGLARMFYQHIDLMTAQAQARMRTDFPSDIAAFDASLAQAYGLADMMSAGK
jgi:hypothetical protein